ncbi:MAG: tetratricopeptide repeat protein [Chloroflexi bacterium]|nr:tetratricopeptide repeat protein [Chloroflexota bacterium]
MQTTPQRKSIWWERIIWFAIGAFIALALLVMLRYVFTVYTSSSDESRGADMILGFLQGASVLIGLALGITAIYGFQNVRDFREQLEEREQEIRDELEEIENEIRQELNKVIELNAQMTIYRPQLERLSEIQSRLDLTEARVTQDIAAAVKNASNYSQAMQLADQELRKQNYPEAYVFANEALAAYPDSALALYMAGWLEVQHIPDKLDTGLEKLERLSQLNPNWPSAQAAYGVGLRRKASQLKRAHQPFDKVLNRARRRFEEALDANFYLTDFNSESYWGPVGGLLRDMGDIDEAIRAYQKALQVTPRSSYPMGNLAALYLQKKDYDNALDSFEKARNFAQTELSLVPYDYFLMMDIAMSSTISGQRNAIYFETAQEMLQNALNSDVIATLLRVSESGWKFLQSNCPAEWIEVKQRIDAALIAIRQKIAEKEEASPKEDN